MEKTDLGGTWKFSIDPMGKGKEKGFEKPEYDDSDWEDMEVPSYWTDEGYYDYHGKAWYRTEFEGKNAEIVKLFFEGVDYYANIWLNGEEICEHEGNFDPFSADISGRLKSGKNTLAVCVDAPEEEPTINFGSIGKKFLAKPDQYLSKRQVKGPLADWDCKTLDLVPGGIFGPVYLRTSKGGAFEEVKVENHLESEDKAHIDIEVRTELKDENLEIRGILEGKNFESKETIEFNENAEEFLKKSIEVEDPRLWWTWDYGAPNLYELKLELLSGEEVLDEWIENVGIRELEVRVKPTFLEQVKDFFQFLNPPIPIPGIPWSKPDPEFWTVKLNGKRIYLRGSNYISNVYWGNVDANQYEKDVELMKKANLNFIRVHAHTEKEEFYNTCDKKGILVDQDFTLQWGYEDSDEFDDAVLNLISRMVKNLRNHPSIGFWTTHNEPPPWNYFGVDKKLEKRVKEINPTRPVIRASGYPGWDGHEYPGWYIGNVEDFQNMGDLFPTEYGAQAFPNMETIKAHAPEEKRWPLDYEWWENHNWQPSMTFKHLSEPNSLEEFVERTQEYQAFVIKVGTEHFRRLKYHEGKPYTGGTVQFMFTDCCSGVTWAVLDIDRRPKKGYYALQESMQPILPSFEWYSREVEHGDDIEGDIYAINDTHRKFENVVLSYKVLSPGANVLEKSEKEFDLREYCSDAVDKLEFKLPGDSGEEGKYTVHMELIHDGEVLSENELWFFVR